MTTAQIAAIVSLLMSFNVSTTTVADVRAVMIKDSAPIVNPDAALDALISPTSCGGRKAKDGHELQPPECI